MTYYNTTFLKGEALAEAVLATQKQREAVLLIYENVRSASPSDVLKITVAAGKGWPLHSIRRAITDLSNEEGSRLLKTSRLVDGLYGKPEHVWVLVAEEPPRATSEENQLELFGGE